MGRSVEERRLGNGLPGLIFGEGPPLAVFPGLGMTNGNPTGVQRWGELRLLAPLARHFIVHRISWRVGLARGTTMADLAADYARAIEEGFRGPVDVLGISTGGSIALQLAADRPDLVNKLVVAGAARRLSEHGRKVQRRAAALSAAGDLLLSAGGDHVGANVEQAGKATAARALVSGGHGCGPSRPGRSCCRAWFLAADCSLRLRAFSTPMADRPRALATASTEPSPQNGSTMVRVAVSSRTTVYGLLRITGATVAAVDRDADGLAATVAAIPGQSVRVRFGSRPWSRN